MKRKSGTCDLCNKDKKIQTVRGYQTCASCEPTIYAVLKRPDILRRIWAELRGDERFDPPIPVNDPERDMALNEVERLRQERSYLSALYVDLIATVFGTFVADDDALWALIKTAQSGLDDEELQRSFRKEAHAWIRRIASARDEAIATAEHLMEAETLYADRVHEQADDIDTLSRTVLELVGIRKRLVSAKREAMETADFLMRQIDAPAGLMDRRSTIPVVIKTELSGLAGLIQDGPRPTPFQQILLEMLEIHDAKRTDYASPGDPLGNFREAERLGISAFKSICVRLQDKYTRMCNLVCRNGEAAVKDESLEDTILDLANYAVLALVARREESHARAGIPQDEGAQDHYGHMQELQEELPESWGDAA